jgi:hypothetical protein
MSALGVSAVAGLAGCCSSGPVTNGSTGQVIVVNGAGERITTPVTIAIYNNYTGEEGWYFFHWESSNLYSMWKVNFTGSAPTGLSDVGYDTVKWRNSISMTKKNNGDYWFSNSVLTTAVKITMNGGYISSDTLDNFLNLFKGSAPAILSGSWNEIGKP